MNEEENNQKIIPNMISIIVPVYNAEKFLCKSIESVINQSYQNIELILVNDGSTDSSEMVCNEYATVDERVKVISQINSGPAASRNTGVQHATGDFVFFLDADDFLEKDAIEILVAAYKQYQPDLVMSNFSKIVNNKEIVKQGISFKLDNGPFEYETKKLTKSDIVEYVRHFLKYPSNHLVSYCWARLYKLSVIKNNAIRAHEDMRLFEDFVFNLDYLGHTNKMMFVNEALYNYTMHNNHMSASMAIINGESLLHDMNVFREKAGEFLQRANGSKERAFDVQQEIGHALIHYLIIFLVRSCRRITIYNRKKIYEEINKIVNAPILTDILQYYSPVKGNSRILPLLMKFKLIGLIMLVCKYKAYKRYGKPEGG